MNDIPARLKVTILSCSLDPESRSRVLAREAERLLQSDGHDPQFIDLRDFSVPEFDNADCYRYPVYTRLHGAIRDSDGVILAVPIYNWSIGSAAKNLIELTGATGAGGRTSAWFDQIVTFLCSAGLPNSYMAYSGLAMSLMLDFKCVINPYVVYASEQDWDAGNAMSDVLSKRLRKTLDVKLELAWALRARRCMSDWEI